MIQLAFYVIFLILLSSIMGKIIYDYSKGRKLKYTSLWYCFCKLAYYFCFIKSCFGYVRESFNYTRIIQW